MNQPIVNLPVYTERQNTTIVESTTDLHAANITPGFHNY